MADQGVLLANRYRLLNVLGDGGMARVYRATDERLNRIVAVKTLHVQYASQPEFVRRFQQEASLVASLSHPNIVRIYDIDHDGETHLIVMEYVDGGSLKALINRAGVLPLRRVATIMDGLCSALDAAHAAGVIHRDIKPENILLTKEEQVKVSDFGIARALDRSNQTQTGMVFGSVSYFSPEQAQGRQATAKSDIYSSGIVLYEMLTRRLPFSSSSPVATAMQHVTQPAPAPRALAPSLPPSVDGVVLTALNKDPALRFASASALAKAFTAAIASAREGAPAERTSVAAAAPAAQTAGTSPGRRPLAPPPPSRPAPREQHPISTVAAGARRPRRRRGSVVIPLVLLAFLGGAVAYAFTGPPHLATLLAGGPPDQPTVVASVTPDNGNGYTLPTSAPAVIVPNATGTPSTQTSVLASASATVLANAVATTDATATPSVTPAPSATPAPTPTVAARATPSPTAATSAGSLRADMVTASSFGYDANGAPIAVNATNTFTSKAARAYVVVSFHHLPTSATTGVRWTLPDGQSSDYTWDHPYLAAYTYLPIEGQGPGAYEVTALVNGKAVAVHDFVVGNQHVKKAKKNGG